MPQRHSKNNTAKSFFTYAEKQAMKMGTIKQRLGTDSHVQFAHCCLTLSPVVDPVATPSGHIYSREAIYEYLLAQKLKLKEQKQRYKAHTRELKRKRDASTAAAEAEKIAKFIHTESGVSGIAALATGAAASIGASSSTSSASATSTALTIASIESSALIRAAKRKREDGEGEAAAAAARSKSLVAELSATAVLDSHIMGTAEDKKEALRRTNFWLPMFTPNEEARVEKPRKRPQSPMSGADLSVKDLVDVKLTRMSDVDDSARSSIVDAATFCCPVTRKKITHQKAVLIKTSGYVISEEAAKMAAYPTMRCPVTGTEFAMDDVIPIVTQGTSFSSHNEVEASLCASSLPVSLLAPPAPAPVRLSTSADPTHSALPRTHNPAHLRLRSLCLACVLAGRPGKH